MKRFLVIIVLCFSCTTFANNKGIPTGLLYRLSKVILTETQNFITPAKPVAQPVKTGKTAPCTLKCLPAKEKQMVPAPITTKVKPTAEALIDTE
jgi:hypothetical protein